MSTSQPKLELPHFSSLSVDAPTTTASAADPGDVPRASASSLPAAAATAMLLRTAAWTPELPRNDLGPESDMLMTQRWRVPRRV